MNRITLALLAMTLCAPAMAQKPDRNAPAPAWPWGSQAFQPAPKPVQAPHKLAEPVKVWYVLNAGTSRCVTLKSMTGLSTPAEMHALFRKGGVIDAVHVVKDDDNMTVIGVMIETIIDGDQGVLTLLPDKARCEVVLRLAMDRGMVPNLDDLK